MSTVNPRGTYLVIAEAIRRQIELGEISSSLPSEAVLMSMHGVSRNTVRRALRVLEERGVVQPVPGVGWRVGEQMDRRPLLERITDVISEDNLAVGDAYPSESKLCERFGVSRTAVRRALAQMEGRGLLETVHGKGRTVRALPAPFEEP
ncbi:GntR family transcriptional regulator [Streptomyces sp. NPDC090093]|uniref:GntR family transcriptional regulator n=1 Tax=Streptomyces sp. NPDC090093 TaxID=3365945 RepID=UPI0038076C3A